MTKAVRIENADNVFDKIVRIQEFNKYTGEFIREYKLVNPTSMKEIYIHDGVYLVIDEVSSE